MDLDISNYSTQEMIDLLNLNIVDKKTITQATEREIEKHAKNKDLVRFFKDIQTHLLDTITEEPPTTTFQTEVKRGTINPDLKPTVTRFINIDSACRANLAPNNLSSDSFDFELSETLLNVVSISLYSVEIPQSWYSNTKKKGTTTFVLCQTPNIEVDPTVPMETKRTLITIPDGNYTTLSLPVVVVDAINAYTNLTCKYSIDPYTAKLTLDFQTQEIIQLIWFDVLFSDPGMDTVRYNSSLGWMLGFRGPITTCVQGVAHAHSVIDPSGTKYIIMQLNDYKTNRINRNMLSVNTLPKIALKQPNYYHQSIPQYKTSSTQIHVLPSAVRQLTSKQIYTINSIEDQATLNPRFVSYDSADAFAKISVKKTDWGKYDGNSMILIDNGPSKLFVDGGGPLQLQMREYFGPVDIHQLSIGLYDDKGHLLGLNGLDWSCTLMVKCIYQY